jgi:hypothetical protein
MRKVPLILTLFFAPMLAQASVIDSALSEAELRGKAVFRFVGIPIYEARLFTTAGAPLDWSRDFGIELEYMRKIGKEYLVGSTMDEFARTGPPPPVKDKLARCFDDVEKGDRYLAITQGQNQIGFWRNGVPVCTLSHPQIARRFMSIFVGDTTRSASFTRRLKGD